MRSVVSIALSPAAFAFGLTICLVDGLSAPCVSGLLDDRALQQTDCTEREGLVVQRYEESQSGNPYATDLDRRVVVVARGERLEALMRAEGIASANGGQTLGKTLLLQPPLEDQVHRRSPSGAARKHKRWLLWSEAIEYVAQGGTQGQRGSPLIASLQSETNVRMQRPSLNASRWRNGRGFLLTLEWIR